MELLKPKVSLIGCGNVGMRYAYALVIRGLARQLVLVDVDRARTEGEAMDLSHGAPYVSPVEIAAGDYPDIQDSDLVVITAGKKQKPGQTRIDLVRDNVALYKKIIPEVVKYAPKAILLIVSNPVDILAYASYRFSGKPANEVIGSGTVLDSARFRSQLAMHCGLDPRNIHAYILGEHGDTEFPVWSKVMIGGVMFKDYCLICGRRRGCVHEKTLNDIFVEVRDSAYKIIERKGETSYGIGLAGVRITQAILENENAILPVSSLINGYQGVRDVYLSLPAVVNRTGIREIMPLGFDESEVQAFKRSAQAVKDVLKEVGL